MAPPGDTAAACMRTPRTKVQIRNLAEASRAAALAAHAAAGLCTLARSATAARLLRSAEASARAATALLVAEAASSGVHPASVSVDRSASATEEDKSMSSGTRAARRRRRRRAREASKAAACAMPMAEDAHETPTKKARVQKKQKDTMPGGAFGSTGRASTARGAASESTASVHTSLPTSAAAATNALDPYSDKEWILTGLSARPELNGKHVNVSGYDARRDRYHVRVVSTGEEIWAEEANIR